MSEFELVHTEFGPMSKDQHSLFEKRSNGVSKWRAAMCYREITNRDPVYTQRPLREVFDELCDLAAELQSVLWPLSDYIDKLGPVPFAEMSLSQKLKIAKVLIMAQGLVE